MLTSLLLLTAATAASAAAGKQCVLAGPAFPAPSNLASSKPLSDASHAFEKLLAKPSLGFMPNDTAWAVAVFSSKDHTTIYDHYYTPPMNVGVKKVDKHSIFRIGSVSKVFSVWSFLIEVGDSRFNDPITKYVPELANLSTVGPTGSIYDDIDSVRWDDVTLEELASQAAGISRDPTSYDISVEYSKTQLEGLGLPALNGSDVPTCGVDGFNKPCSRAEILKYLVQQHPTYAPQSSPAYSNFAYTLLNYAQETITGKAFNTTVTEGIIQKLGMHNSSYSVTPARGGVIPGNNAESVGWNQNLGQDAPSGSFYSSINDMVIAGQAMLQSSLLDPAQTRRWMRPVIQTGYLGTAVGAPWEIRYLTTSDDQLVDAYTKQGDVGNYHAGLVLSPQHELGYVVLTVGTAKSNAEALRTQIYDTLGDLFVPMADQEARSQARLNFNGTYVDEATNSSAVIEVDDKQAGLKITQFISHGRLIVGPASPLIQSFGAGEVGYLLPSQLRTTKSKCNGSESYDSRLGFRATFFNETDTSEMTDPCLLSWTALGAPTYGLISLDDWVFDMGEDGKAESLNVRFWRLNLRRET